MVFTALKPFKYWYNSFGISGSYFTSLHLPQSFQTAAARQTPRQANRAGRAAGKGSTSYYIENKIYILFNASYKIPELIIHFTICPRLSAFSRLFHFYTRLKVCNAFVYNLSAVTHYTHTHTQINTHKLWKFRARLSFYLLPHSCTLRTRAWNINPATGKSAYLCGQNFAAHNSCQWIQSKTNKEQLGGEQDDWQVSAKPVA